MARHGRYFLPDQPLHVIQRGNNRQAIFFCADDYRCFHAWLADAAAARDCAVHAYVLMTNHLHLLVTPGNEASLPGTMQALGRRYVRHVNTANRRTGTLWEVRYRAVPINSEAYFLACFGRSAADRRQAYRALFLPPLEAAFLDAPRAAMNGGWALGDERFTRNLAAALGMCADLLPKGRRPKTAEDPGPNLL